MKHKVRQMIFIFVFFIIVITPQVLMFFSTFFEKPLDTKLKGYFDSYEKPLLTADGFFSKKYQGSYEKWFDNSLKPRNIYIKLYNQLQWSCFDLANRIVGKNKDIFEYEYIKDVYCLDGYDYSLPEKSKEMQKYVNCLKDISRKLEAADKHLIVYTTSSKAHWSEENIPDMYSVQKVENGMRAVDCFRQLISATDVNYLDSDVIASSSEYPLFYPTGIHWARPVEQETTVALVNEMNRLFNKKHRQIILSDIQKSNKPFWRDSDVYDLANIMFDNYDITYYQYNAKRDMPKQFDKMRVLLQGGSFAQGFIYDYFNIYSGDELYYINYNKYIESNKGIVQLNEWKDLDLQSCLDNVDYVVIEMSEAVIHNYSYGFAQYLNYFLDTYKPDLSDDCSADYNLDASKEKGLTYSKGFYNMEKGHVWASQDAALTLKNENIYNNGLELEYFVDNRTLSDNKITVYLYVNQKLLKEISYDKSGKYKVYIPPEELNFRDNANCDIEIICSNSFNPSEMGDSNDGRNLGLDIMYIGEVR